MIPKNHLCIKEGTGTTSATPGTRPTVTHGLGTSPRVAIGDIEIYQIALADTDVGENIGPVAVVAVTTDGTGFRVKANVSSLTYRWRIWRTVDDVGRS